MRKTLLEIQSSLHQITVSIFSSFWQMTLSTQETLGIFLKYTVPSSMYNLLFLMSASPLMLTQYTCILNLMYCNLDSKHYTILWSKSLVRPFLPLPIGKYFLATKCLDSKIIPKKKKYFSFQHCAALYSSYVIHMKTI